MAWRIVLASVPSYPQLRNRFAPFIDDPGPQLVAPGYIHIISSIISDKEGNPSKYIACWYSSNFKIIILAFLQWSLHTSTTTHVIYPVLQHYLWSKVSLSGKLVECTSLQDLMLCSLIMKLGLEIKHVRLLLCSPLWYISSITSWRRSRKWDVLCESGCVVTKGSYLRCQRGKRSSKDLRYQ